MPIIDPRAAERLQPELLSGETIYWAAMPSPNKVFDSDDWAMIPFSFLCGGFAIFWEAGVLGYWQTVQSIHRLLSSWQSGAFIIIGQYMICGRVVLDAWFKRRTYYAVTNRRTLVLQEGWKRKTNIVFLESLPKLSREGTALGTL